MIIDSSAVVAILGLESDAREFVDAIEKSPERRLSKSPVFSMKSANFQANFSSIFISLRAIKSLILKQFSV